MNIKQEKQLIDSFIKIAIYATKVNPEFIKKPLYNIMKDIETLIGIEIPNDYLNQEIGYRIADIIDEFESKEEDYNDE